MEKLKHIGMVTTVILVSFTNTTTRINLDIVTSLLVGAIPMGEGGGDLPWMMILL